ncbi:hypothetical protein [Streptomyces beihaiensis]|uniref:Uncharacterized protein n=1 Tax=Streptomyces beihaiensis TaxID=2984495 RepID=A0ABT3TUT7_9ACTN|nr:hypothetical protein [Streptomyces beihaiensis]MCX3060797.1 hypothetical protein [Streptomyces beihaiensis]
MPTRKRAVGVRFAATAMSTVAFFAPQALLADGSGAASLLCAGSCNQ